MLLKLMLCLLRNRVITCICNSWLFKGISRNKYLTAIIKQRCLLPHNVINRINIANRNHVDTITKKEDFLPSNLAPFETVFQKIQECEAFAACGRSWFCQGSLRQFHHRWHQIGRGRVAVVRNLSVPLSIIVVCVGVVSPPECLWFSWRECNDPFLWLA